MPASVYDSGKAGAEAKWDRQRKWMADIKAGGAQRDAAMRTINALTSKEREEFARICKAYGIDLK